jgi:hypothetical protein
MLMGKVNARLIHNHKVKPKQQQQQQHPPALPKYGEFTELAGCSLSYVI